MLNVAKDNVRYVGALEPYWDPLYRCSPIRISDYLRSLIGSLRNVYVAARYYNTMECVASFLVKTTNQLTIACKDYLTEHNTVGIFDQDSNLFIYKITVSIIGYSFLEGRILISPFWHTGLHKFIQSIS